MPSPFPGMDPWLESPGVFPDLHSSFATYLRAALTKALPRPFFAAISTRVYMEESDRRTEPDVDVLSPANGPPAAGTGATGTAIAQRQRTNVFDIPALPWPDEEITESFIEIRTAADGDRLITSIEILSPTYKKRGANGRGIYLAKQLEMRQLGVNLIEIDLLRVGAHATMATLAEIRRQVGQYEYHVCVTKTAADKCQVVPIRLEKPLPPIDIPLTLEVATVATDLQPVLDRCYDEADYSRRIRYTQPCDPPLTPEQQPGPTASSARRGC